MTELIFHDTSGSTLPYGRVAVITRTKNREILLRRALLSIASQTFGDYINVIVNDGGDPAQVDRALTVLSPGARAKVQVIHHPESLGMEAASNAGIAACDSKYIAMHDDDDSWDSQFLEKTVAAIGTSEGVATHYYIVLEGMENGLVKTISRKRYGHSQITLFKMTMENQFANLCFLFSRRAFQTIGDFNPKLPVLGDWEFNIRFLSKYDIELLPEPLANYHQRINASSHYGNSVRVTLNKVERYRSIICNDLLRKDLEAGRTGLGLIANLGLELREILARVALFQVANPILINILDRVRGIVRYRVESRALAQLDRQWQRSREEYISSADQTRPQRTNEQ